MDGQAVAVPATIPGECAQDEAARVAALFDAHHQRLLRLASCLAREAGF